MRPLHFGNVCLSSRWAMPRPAMDPPRMTTVWPVIVVCGDEVDVEL